MSTKPNKDLAKVKTLTEIKDRIGGCKNQDDPDIVLKEADNELSKVKEGINQSVGVESNVFKSMTLLEFDNGTLLATVVAVQYRTFGIDLMRNLQKEYNCQTPSEKATAELTALNYIRTLEIQNRINRYLAIGTLTDTGVRYLAIMSKELDRANRHYLTAVQVLKNMKQLPFQLTLKTNTAVIGQNQIVQSNTNE